MDSQGSLDLYTIGNVIQTQEINSELLVFGLVFIVVGIAFKLGAVPFQMWVPDVYEGSITPVTMMISTSSKVCCRCDVDSIPFSRSRLPSS
jgi:NADH-quinone oxidoreductase subunit N